MSTNYLIKCSHLKSKLKTSATKNQTVQSTTMRNFNKFKLQPNKPEISQGTSGNQNHASRAL